MKNIKEFNELIERYETIQIDEINSVWRISGLRTANKLTGFGATETCKLCEATRPPDSFGVDCTKCVYGGLTECNAGHMFDTYQNIYYARTPEEFLQAYRNRAKAMREFLKMKKD